MNTITLQTIQSASIKDLKAFAVANDIQIDGDKRKKASFVDSIEAYLIECGDLKTVANQAGIDSGSALDITLEKLEASQTELEAILPAVASSNDSEVFTCAYPAQSVSDFINISEHIDSTIQQPELEPQAKEIANVPSEVVEPVNAGFRKGSTVITMFAPLAVLLVGALMASVWLTIRLGVVLKPVMQYCLRLIDSGLTAILETVVDTTDYLFGDTDTDDYSHDMQEIVHLI